MRWPWQYRARRRLRTTRAGAALIAVTFASGFAAFNTGNNLLFFGWGLLLSSIVVSGILSEACSPPRAGMLISVPSAACAIFTGMVQCRSFSCRSKKGCSLTLRNT